MIAVVYPQFYSQVGGIARYLDSWLANLPAHPAKVLLVTDAAPGKARSYPGIETVQVPIGRHRLGLFLWGLKIRRLLREWYRSGRIRSVNFHWPPLIPGLLLPGEVPMVLTAHTTYLGMSGRFYSPAQYASQWNTASLTTKLWMERRILAKAAKVVTLTEQGREELGRYAFAGPVAVVPNGADARRFRPDENAPKQFDVLFCGRIERRKGSRPMVAVCKALIAQLKTIRIAIVGYGDDEDWVRGELKNHEANVHLAGKVPFDGVMAFYNASRIYVSTSYYEGLPGTCLEAMAMQLPVIVWDFPFYEGLVLPGETGFVVPSNDVPAMARRILALLRDPASGAAMGRKGRDLLITRYDWQTLAGRILTEIDS